MSDTAIISLVTGAVTIVTTIITFLTLWIKVKYGLERTEDLARKTDVVESKIDDNTKITKVGVTAAATNARTAAVNAAEARIVAENIDKKLNGGIDGAITDAVGPLKKIIEGQSDAFVTKKEFQELTEYIRQRNHDFLDKLSAQSNKMETLLILIEKKRDV